jgi:hypothetical protein
MYVGSLPPVGSSVPSVEGATSYGSKIGLPVAGSIGVVEFGFPRSPSTELASLASALLVKLSGKSLEGHVSNERVRTGDESD